MLIRSVRLLAPRSAGSPSAPLDVRTRGGAIAEIGTRLTAQPGEDVHEADGAIAIPGLWDQHVHVGQVAQGYSRLDTSEVRGTDAALTLVARTLADRLDETPALVGFGHRLADFAFSPTVAALDSVAPTTPVVLIGGDAHHAWMNSAALTGLGMPPRDGIVGEDEWFDVLAHLDDLPGVAEGLEYGVALLQSDALARGLVGLVDVEWARNYERWAVRRPRLRVRAATYIADLPGVPGPSGTPLEATGLARMGPLKVIADGSIGSRSAYSRDGSGMLNLDTEELIGRLEAARASGLDVAVHAIGDAAAVVALDAFAATGMRGRIEHAQMLADEDIERMAALGITGSVQPAHLLDDRDITEQLGEVEATRSYRFRDLLDAGVPLVLGSDAPVAPLDPWLAMAAAIHRSADERPGWRPAQSLQPREALAASTDGVTDLDIGGPADLVLLEEDPFGDVPYGRDGLPDDGAARECAARLRTVRPLATIVAGALAASR
ncbi:MAG: amidohydrolase family protein [Brachybacterium sp.]|nr:amidohydrolase family protein [Brachybacterium sp.]